MYRVIAVLVVAAACVRSTPTLEPSLEPSNTIAVTIDNEHTSDADVYAVRLANRVHVGFVQSHSTAVVQVPVGFLDNGDLRLFLHLVGSGIDYTSPLVHVDAGQQAMLDLEPQLSLSSFTVR